MKTRQTPGAKSPEQARRERRLGEALRANLKRRKAAARKAAQEPETDEADPLARHIQGEDLPGDERG